MNYLEQMKEDIRNYIEENGIVVTSENVEEMQEKLYDDLWTEDSVTGNGSGSYTFNSYKAKEYVVDNMELVQEMVSEFCIDSNIVAEKFLNEDWEYFDVSIRCYLLGQAIDDTLNEIIEEVEE